MRYKCGHELHPACGQDVRECFLCFELVPVIYQKKIDASLKMRPEIFSGGLPDSLEDVEYQIKRESKL